MNSSCVCKLFLLLEKTSSRPPQAESGRRAPPTPPDKQNEWRRIYKRARVSEARVLLGPSSWYERLDKTAGILHTMRYKILCVVRHPFVFGRQSVPPFNVCTSIFDIRAPAGVAHTREGGHTHRRPYFFFLHPPTGVCVPQNILYRDKDFFFRFTTKCIVLSASHSVRVLY